jgi:hypothetical protein
VSVEGGSAYVDAGATAFDVVSGSLAVTSTGSVNTLVVGAYTIGYTATDASGNVGSASRVVNVVDTTAPALGPVSDVTAEATGPAGAVVTYATPTATDIVDSSVDVACVAPSGSVFPLGASTVTCTATDDAGRSSSANFTVTVRDTTAPVLGAMSNVTAEATSGAGAVVTYPSPTATDVVDTSVSVSCVAPSGSVFPLGDSTVTCTATDDSGRSSSGGFTVTVLDTTPPVLTVPANVTQSLPSGGGSSMAVTYSATATDAVSTPTVSCSPASGSLFVFGTTTVNCTATDAAANATSRSFTVTVNDTTAPTSLTASVSPTFLWPPDGSIVNVTVSGQVLDGESGAVRIAWSVRDEYGTYQPTGTATVANGAYSLQVPLLRDRRGNDKNGRHYTINMTVYDRAGNSRVLANPPVVNIHDKSGF